MESPSQAQILKACLADLCTDWVCWTWGTFLPILWSEWPIVQCPGFVLSQWSTPTTQSTQSLEKAWFLPRWLPPLGWLSDAGHIQVALPVAEFCPYLLYTNHSSISEVCHLGHHSGIILSCCVSCPQESRCLLIRQPWINKNYLKLKRAEQRTLSPKTSVDSLKSTFQVFSM